MNDTSEAAADDSKYRLHDILGIIVVLCVAVLPDAFNACVLWAGWVDAPSGFAYIQLALIVRALQVSAPVLLIVLVTHVNWQSVGFVQVRWLRDFLMGLGIWLLGTFAFYATCSVMPASVFPSPEVSTNFEHPTEIFGFLLLLAGSCANGFAEELIIRGYLLTRLECVLRSTWSAVLITSLLFAAYHLYQGVGSMIGIAVLGLVYGTAFCVCRRIWPLVFAHAVADFTGWLAA